MYSFPRIICRGLPCILYKYHCDNPKCTKTLDEYIALQYRIHACKEIHTETLMNHRILVQSIIQDVYMHYQQ